MWKTFLNLLFPPIQSCGFCNGFGKINDKTGICSSCESKIEFIKTPYCYKCGKYFQTKEMYSNYNLCPECQKQNYDFTLARAACIYCDIIQESVHRLKFQHHRSDADWLGKIILKGMKNYPEILDFDVIVPVPLHQERLLERGYNQAELLGQVVADFYKRPLLTNCLKRSKSTSQQSLLSRQDRFKNIKNAFVVDQEQLQNTNIENKNILLIDDVFTTGSTTNECARTLIKAGVAKVLVLTLATGKIIL